MADARQQQQLADDAQQQQHQQQPSLVAGLLSNLEARVAAQMPEHAVEVLDTHRYAPAPAGNDARPNVTAAAAAARDPPIEVTSELVRTLAVLLRAHSAGGVPEAARAAIALVDSPTATPEDVAGARQAWRWLVARSRARPELCKTEGEAAAFEAYLPMVESRANSRARPPPNGAAAGRSNRATEPPPPPPIIASSSSSDNDDGFEVVPPMLARGAVHEEDCALPKAPLNLPSLSDGIDGESKKPQRQQAPPPPPHAAPAPLLKVHKPVALPTTTHRHLTNHIWLHALAQQSQQAPSLTPHHHHLLTNALSLQQNLIAQLQRQQQVLLDQAAPQPQFGLPAIDCAKQQPDQQPQLPPPPPPPSSPQPQPLQQQVPSPTSSAGNNNSSKRKLPQQQHADAADEYFAAAALTALASGVVPAYAEDGTAMPAPQPRKRARTSNGEGLKPGRSRGGMPGSRGMPAVPDGRGGLAVRNRWGLVHHRAGCQCRPCNAWRRANNHPDDAPTVGNQMHLLEEMAPPPPPPPPPSLPPPPPPPVPLQHQAVAVAAAAAAAAAAGMFTAPALL